MRVRLPSDVGALHSLGFVRRAFRRRRPRLLEVGCGDGTLARALVACGFEVTAIDQDHRAVSRARRRGVDARRADFLEWTAGGFDVVLFSRSLHHLRPLDRAMRRAAGILVPRGRVAVEDFAVDAVDGPTAEWLYRRLRGLAADGLLPPAVAALGVTPPLDRWRREHRGVAREAALRRALHRHFVVRETAVPYLYRYAVASLRPGRRALEVARALFREETALVRSGSIRAIGRRWIGAPRALQTAGHSPRGRRSHRTNRPHRGYASDDLTGVADQ